MPKPASLPAVLRPAALVALALAALALAPAAASAAGHGVVRLAAERFTAREGDGAATVTIVRSDARGRGQIRYGVWYARSATEHQDYKPVSGRLDFEVGQREVSFRVPIVDDDVVEGRETARVGIFGAHPMRTAEPTRAELVIVDDDEVSAERDPANPLGLDPAPPGDSPLQGARFYVDRRASLVLSATRGKPSARKRLRVIAEQPETKRFGTWTKRPQHGIATYLQRVQHEDPGAIPLVATYRLKHLQCGGVSDSRKDVRSYKRWYDRFAAGIGNQPIVLFYEIDALITAKCLSRTGLKRRVEEARYAIDVLSRLPHAVVYVDAGSGLAHTPRFIAKLLRKVRVHKIQGFFTNATHQNWTSREIRYGRTLMRLLGGRPHHVVNTSGNGRGPLVPKDKVAHGNSFRCNAPGRGLGPKPTGDVPARYRNLDGFFWIGNPGRSAGRCALKLYDTAPPTGAFWLSYAFELVRHADFRIR